MGDIHRPSQASLITGRLRPSGPRDAKLASVACGFCDIQPGRRIVEQRFLLLSDVAEILNISASQAYALVRNEELKAIKIGGRGQWRVERTALEEYIARAYSETQAFIRANPLGRAESVPSD